jgi:hypothetical protein
VLTNQTEIDISAAPPEFSSGELQSQTTPTLPRSPDLTVRSGLDRWLLKVLIGGMSQERQYMAILIGSSDEKREDPGSMSLNRIK